MERLTRLALLVVVAALGGCAAHLIDLAKAQQDPPAPAAEAVPVEEDSEEIEISLDTGDAGPWRVAPSSPVVLYRQDTGEAWLLHYPYSRGEWRKIVPEEPPK
jgi:hypothetical protein